jgi:hypothetical protein
MIASMGKSLIVHTHICTKKIKSFMNQSLILKEIKPWHPLGVCPQCNLGQMNHKWTSLTNLMEHIQSFGVLSTSAPSNPNSSSSLFKQPSPSCTHWHMLSNTTLTLWLKCWSSFFNDLNHSSKNVVPLLEIWIKNAS